MQSIWDFLISYAIGLAFCACYFPLLMLCMRATMRVPPTWVLSLVRWVVLPAVMFLVTWWLFGWSRERVFVSQVSYYAAALFRLLRVLRGKKPSDEQMLIGLFVAAQGREFQKFLEKKGGRFVQDDNDASAD